MLNGTRALHVIVPRGREQARRLARAYGRIDRGLTLGPRGFGLESMLVEGFRLELRGGRASIGLDGEVRRVPVPLVYRVARDRLNYVGP